MKTWKLIFQSAFSSLFNFHRLAMTTDTIIVLLKMNKVLSLKDHCFGKESNHKNIVLNDLNAKLVYDINSKP